MFAATFRGQMGRQANQSRATVLDKVEECLTQVNVSIALSQQLTETQNLMAAQLGREVDRVSTDMNVLHEKIAQANKRHEVATRADALTFEDITDRFNRLNVKIRTVMTDERLARLQEDSAGRAALLAFQGMTLLERVKWLLFGAVPRPAAAPESKTQEAEPMLLRGPALEVAMIGAGDSRQGL